MPSTEGKYNIKAVSKLLGIQPGTLRAWERRYKIISPVRNDLGHRLYTEEQLIILQSLKEKVSSGFTVSQAVNLLEKDMRKNNIKPPNEGDSLTTLVNKIFDLLVKFDENQAREQLDCAFSLFSLDKVVMEIIDTLSNKIRLQHQVGEITSAQEYFARSYLRLQVELIIKNLPVPYSAPKVIACCGPNERYENLLRLVYFLKRKGLLVTCIGTSVNVKDLKQVITTVMPNVLVMSCSQEEYVIEMFEFVHLLSSKTLQVGVSGLAKDNVPSLYQDYIMGNTGAEWEVWLQEKLGY